MSCEIKYSERSVLHCDFLNPSGEKKILAQSFAKNFYRKTLPWFLLNTFCGPGSSVGIATGYGLDGPGSNLGGGEIFRTCPDRPWGPPSLLYNGYRVFTEDKVRPGSEPDPSPFLV